MRAVIMKNHSVEIVVYLHLFISSRNKCMLLKNAYVFKNF